VANDRQAALLKEYGDVLSNFRTFANIPSKFLRSCPSLRLPLPP
jgi:hypothetical protein